MPDDRRSFLGRLAAGAVLANGALFVAPSRAAAAHLASRSETWDLSWAEKLTGKHRAVLDSPEISEGLALLRALVYRKDYGEVSGANPEEITPVVVLRHNAIWLIMDDEFWAHHHVGTVTNITDPKTRLPITRNPVLGVSPWPDLPPDIAKGVLSKVLASATVLACNLAFQEIVEQVKKDMKLEDAKAREMALHHVVPGIILQPSGVFAVTRAQEAGCVYLLAS